MFRIQLKSNIHRAPVTDCRLVTELFAAATELTDNVYAKDNQWDT